MSSFQQHLRSLHSPTPTQPPLHAPLQPPLQPLQPLQAPPEAPPCAQSFGFSIPQRAAVQVLAAPPQLAPPQLVQWLVEPRPQAAQVASPQQWSMAPAQTQASSVQEESRAFNLVASPAAKRGKDPTCTICLDSLAGGAVQVLDCSHAYHAGCLARLKELGVQPACPLCTGLVRPAPSRICGGDEA